MATTFKNFLSNDIANTRTLLHEAIPITGSIVSGTYNDGGGVAIGSEHNIKTYGHGMFESTFDYPYLSSSANHIFDVTVGYSNFSDLSASTNTQQAKKINLYNQMAQYLVGYDETGSIKKFNMPVNNIQMDDGYFINFARLLTKDEIKKGSFTMELSISGNTTFHHGSDIMSERIQITDYSGADGYYVDSPAGEYGVLYATASAGGDGGQTGFLGANEYFRVGLLYYQAGVAFLSGNIFTRIGGGGILNDNIYLAAKSPKVTTAGVEDCLDFRRAVTGSTIQEMAQGLRNRIYNISYNNTTELNSTIYFCRIGHSDFNYSANPTYLTGSEIRVKTRASDTPVSYFTTVGLYSADNELLAVAKLSEPLRKDPTNEVTLRVRLDY